MKVRLISLWSSFSLREKAVIIAAALIVAAILYVWLVHSATQARARLTTKVSLLRTQAAQLEQQSVEYAKLRAAPLANATQQTDLRALVQSHTDNAGLTRTVVKFDVQDANRMQLSFGAVSFAAWLDWANSLQSQQVRIESCRIEALSTPGLVSITVSLARTPAR